MTEINIPRRKLPALVAKLAEVAVEKDDEMVALRARVAALQGERDAAVTMLVAGVHAYLNNEGLHFWAMGAEAMYRQLAAAPPATTGSGEGEVCQ